MCFLQRPWFSIIPYHHEIWDNVNQNGRRELEICTPLKRILAQSVAEFNSLCLGKCGCDFKSTKLKQSMGLIYLVLHWRGLNDSEPHRYLITTDSRYNSVPPGYSISQEICTRFLLCCALLRFYIDWFSHIHHAYFTGTVAIYRLPQCQQSNSDEYG